MIPLHVQLVSSTLRGVLKRLPTQLNSRIDELLPQRWTPTGTLERDS